MSLLARRTLQSIDPRQFLQGLGSARSTIHTASALWRLKPAPHLMVTGANIELLPDGSRSPRRFKIKLVETAEKRHRIDELLHWRRRGPGHQTMRPPTDPLVRRFTLAATAGADTIGMITVSFDGSGGLVADRSFGPEVDQLRAQGRKICEFGHLVVDPTVSTKRVLASLFHVCYIVAYRIRGYDLLLIEVNPQHLDYYVGMLGFRLLGSERINQVVHAPAVLLGVDFDHVMKQIGEFGGQTWRMSTERSLYPAALSLTEEAVIITRLQAQQRGYDLRVRGASDAPSAADPVPSEILAVG